MIPIGLIRILVALVGSAVVVHKFVLPRLPVYTIRIGGLPKLTKSALTGEWFGVVSAGVEMFNANYIQLDVHALYFDMYTSSNQTELLHIGNIQDKQGHSNNTGAKKAPSIWSVAPRKNFSARSSLFLKLKFSPAFWSGATLARQWWYSSGRVVLPITGVVHIRAVNTKKNSTRSLIPLTVGLICDNLVDTWTMTVSGLDCVLHSTQLGFKDLEKSAKSVRDYAVSKLKVNATGGVLLHS